MKAGEHPEMFRDFIISQRGQKKFDKLKALAYLPVKLDYTMVLMGLQQFDKEVK